MAAKNRLFPWFAAPGAALSAKPITEADFEDFYRRELPRVYNYFRYRVGEGPIAEDLTSETFEKAWRSRDRYRRDLAAFSTWLFTIARRVAQDYYRKLRSMRALSAVSLDTIEGERESRRTTVEPAGHPEDDPQELIEQKADFARLALLLARLDDRERELVALKYGAGLTNRAIAQLSGFSESNVGVILYRAIQTLRAGWEEHE